jgi:hypothetical protein
LHPEQEAQQSAEPQHDAFAAFTAPAKPSAITATNRETGKEKPETRNRKISSGGDTYNYHAASKEKS